MTLPEIYNTLNHTTIHRPINDYTTHKEHIYTKHQNTQ